MADPDFLQPPPTTVLETERLRLRTVTLDDVNALMPIITDRETMKFTSGIVANDRDVARRWLSARALGKDVFNFIIELKDAACKQQQQQSERATVVGILGSFHCPEVGYLIHPAHAGKGYATEAMRAFAAAFFERTQSPSLASSSTNSESHATSSSSPPPQTIGFDFIQAETDAANIASHRVLEKSGFSRVETLTAAFESPILGLRDTVVWRLARPGMTLEDLGLVERPVRSLERWGLGGRKLAVKEDEEKGFTPPVS